MNKSNSENNSLTIKRKLTEDKSILGTSSISNLTKSFKQYVDSTLTKT
jgi:hypothetical protein